MFLKAPAERDARRAVDQAGSELGGRRILGLEVQDQRADAERTGSDERPRRNARRVECGFTALGAVGVAAAGVAVAVAVRGVIARLGGEAKCHAKRDANRAAEAEAHAGLAQMAHAR